MKTERKSRDTKHEMTTCRKKIVWIKESNSLQTHEEALCIAYCESKSLRFFSVSLCRCEGCFCFSSFSFANVCCFLFSSSSSSVSRLRHSRCSLWTQGEERRRRRGKAGVSRKNVNFSHVFLSDSAPTATSSRKSFLLSTLRPLVL
jgi:hypothetical protein